MELVRCAECSLRKFPPSQDKPLIAASMFGVTTGCVTQVRKLLEQGGYELLIFHATGTGGRAMEALISDGYFAGVADITTTEWADQVDRKSTRLNSSHVAISYAVFCLKKKK